MKKLITGLTILALTPFLIIFGSYAIAHFQVSENVQVFACAMGGIATVFNFVIACALVVRGHQESGTFKGWKA